MDVEDDIFQFLCGLIQLKALNCPKRTEGEFLFSIDFKHYIGNKMFSKQVVGQEVMTKLA